MSKKSDESSPGPSSESSISSSSVSSSISSSASSSAANEKGGKGKGKDANEKGTKRKRDPNAPKKPMTSYMLYMQAIRPTVVTNHPNLKFGEVSKKISEDWKQLTEDQKKVRSRPRRIGLLFDAFLLTLIIHFLPRLSFLK